MLLTRDLTSLAPSFVTKAGRQRYKQTMQCIHVSGVIHEGTDLMIEIDRWIRLMLEFHKRFSLKLYDVTTARLSLKVRMLKAEVIEILPYGCEAWTLSASHYDKLRQAHHEAHQ